MADEDTTDKPSYAILRAMLGILAVFGSRSRRRVFFWILLADCVSLTFAGGQPPEGAWLAASRLGAAYFFVHFMLVLPLVLAFEQPSPLPVSISLANRLDDSRS